MNRIERRAVQRINLIQKTQARTLKARTERIDAIDRRVAALSSAPLRNRSRQ